LEAVAGDCKVGEGDGQKWRRKGSRSPRGIQLSESSHSPVAKPDAEGQIDRHIRALDSALSAQEASILLGLRPSTLPSTAVENGLENGDTGALADIEEGTMGTGGGGARRKGRGARGRGRGRGGARGGGRVGETAAPAIAEAVIEPQEFADVDPYVYFLSSEPG